MGSKPAPIVVYRIQAVDGRGPWRPGWSHTWIDDRAPAGRLTETVMDLYPGVASLPPTMHYGSACRSYRALLEWFTPRERRVLAACKFYPVRLVVDVIVAESKWQMLIGRRRPFTDGATRLSWPDDLIDGQ